MHSEITAFFALTLRATVSLDTANTCGQHYSHAQWITIAFFALTLRATVSLDTAALQFGGDASLDHVPSNLGLAKGYLNGEYVYVCVHGEGRADMGKV